MNLNNNDDEQNVISDEVEELELDEKKEEPFNIKTVIVKQEDEEDEETKKSKLMKAVKMALGVGIIAAAGAAALFFNLKKKK